MPIKQIEPNLPHASLDELLSAAQFFADWFAEFVDDAPTARLSWRERAAINAYFDEVADICDEIRRVMKNAKSWRPE